MKPTYEWKNIILADEALRMSSEEICKVMRKKPNYHIVRDDAGRCVGMRCPEKRTLPKQPACVLFTKKN